MGNSRRSITQQKPRVLVIDDDTGVLERTRDYLGAKGLNVRTTANVFEIPSIVGTFAPELVVLDLKMPALSGEGVAITLKRMCDVPIVFYSAVSADEGRAATAQHKGSTFVSKANGVRELFAGIDAMLQARSVNGVEDGA